MSPFDHSWTPTRPNQSDVEPEDGRRVTTPWQRALVLVGAVAAVTLATSLAFVNLLGLAT